MQRPAAAALQARLAATAAEVEWCTCHITVIVSGMHLGNEAAKRLLLSFTSHVVNSTDARGAKESINCFLSPLNAYHPLHCILHYVGGNGGMGGNAGRSADITVLVKEEDMDLLSLLGKIDNSTPKGICICMCFLLFWDFRR